MRSEKIVWDRAGLGRAAQMLNHYLRKARDNKNVWLLLTIFLLSFSLRLICFLQIKQTPLFGFFARDSIQYEEFAMEILKGRFFVPEAIYFNAVYPFFLALIYFLFGHSLTSVLLIQIVMSAMTTVFLYLICIKLSNNKVISLLAALIYAGYDLSIFFTVILLDTTFSAFLIVSLVLALMYAADGHHPGCWFLSGVIFGLSLVLRTNIAIFLPFLAGWLSIRKNMQRRQKRKAISHFCLGIILILTPFSLRRYFIDRGFSPFPVSAGLNFYIGNNPEATGGFVSLEHLNISVAPVELIRQSVTEAERETGTKLSVSAASNYWFVKGLQFIKDNPSRFIILSLKKILLFWNKNEGESNINFYFSKKFLPLYDLPLFSFVIISPLALTGMMLVLWRRVAGFSLIILFVFAYMLSIVPFFMASRYRFPCVPIIIILAAYTTESFWRALRNTKIGESFTIVILAMVFFLVVNANIPGVIASDNFSVAQFNLGNLYMEQGLLDEAAREYLMISRSDPNYPRSRYNLGMVYERMGKINEAMAAYNTVLEAKPDFIKAHNNLGLLYFKKGLKEEALRHYREALAINPDFDAALVNLGWYYRDKGMTKEAREAYQQALAINPDNAVANYDLAVLFYYAQDFEKAVDHYQKALRLGYNSNPVFFEALKAHMK